MRGTPMKRTWRMVAGVVVVLLGGVLGCKSKEIKVSRPNRADEYVLPPDHPRFSQPVAYPSELLNKGKLPKNDPSQFTPGPTRPVNQLNQPGPSL